MSNMGIITPPLIHIFWFFLLLSTLKKWKVDWMIDPTTSITDPITFRQTKQDDVKWGENKQQWDISPDYCECDQ